MGTWSPAIFGDDVAIDVRNDLRDLLTQGMTTEDATDRLLQMYADSISDPDDEPVFWLVGRRRPNRRS